MKAVQVMIDKEKTRMKKARAEETGVQGDKSDGTPADEGKKTKDKPKNVKVSHRILLNRKLALLHTDHVVAQSCGRRR